MKSETKRLIAAVLGAPLFIGVIAGLVGMLVGGPELFVMFFAAAAGLALICMLVIGLPWHFLMQRIGRSDLLAYLSGAVLAGCVLTYLNAALIGLQISIETFPVPVISLLSVILACAFTAAIAWAIARPDRGRDAPGAENPK